MPFPQATPYSADPNRPLLEPERLRAAILDTGYPIVASEGPAETAIYLLTGVRHLRRGLTERGIPIGSQSGLAAAPASAALAEIDRLREAECVLRVGLNARGVSPGTWPVDAALAAIDRHRVNGLMLERVLDEHGGRGADEPLLDAVKRVLAAKGAEIASLRSELGSARLARACAIDEFAGLRDRVCAAGVESTYGAVCRVLAAKDSEIAGLRSDVRAAEQAYEQRHTMLGMCHEIIDERGGFRAGESTDAGLRRLLKKADGEIVAHGRRIEDLRAAGESLSTVMGQLSAAEMDLSAEKVRASAMEAKADNLGCLCNALEARAEKAEAEVARLSAPVAHEGTARDALDAIADALDAAGYAGGVTLRGLNGETSRVFRGRALEILRGIGRRAPSDRDEEVIRGGFAVIDAFHNFGFGQAPNRVAGEFVLDVVAKNLLPELAERRAADGKPVDVEVVIEQATHNIGHALRAANHGFAADALTSWYASASASNAALRKAVADVLRSLARQAPNAAAKDESERAIQTERLRLAERIAAKQAEWEADEKAAHAAAEHRDAYEWGTLARGIEYAIGIVKHS